MTRRVYQLIPKKKMDKKEGKRTLLWGIDHNNADDLGIRKPITEFELMGMPQSVKELLDMFQFDEHFAVICRIDDDCFVYDARYTIVDSWLQEYFRERYLFKLQWELWNTNRERQEVCICSRTGQNTISCWDFLCKLSMDDFSSSRLSCPLNIGAEQTICPFSCEILEKFILQHQKAKCGFAFLTFTPSQCRTLATGGTRTHLDFSNCRFQDDGLAFMEAYLSAENQDLGPTKLRIEHSLFGDPMLIACLSKLKELTLEFVDLSSELLRTVVSAELDYLSLWSVNHDDAAVQILISNIREGRGPKGIVLPYAFLGSRENLLNFCNALLYLHGHQYLKTLELRGGYGDCDFGPEAETAFLAAWTKNLGLTSFHLAFFQITETFWNSLLTQISLQSSLRKLEFFWLRILNSTATDKERTEQLSNAILANGHIDQMEFCSSVFDEEVWQKRVIQALQQNQHRERFSALETIGDGPTRKAIIAEALIKVSDRPSLLYASLHRNWGNVVGELGH